MGRMSKNKGARGERELANELERLFKCQAHRGRQYSGGSESPDVVTTIDGVHIECKRVEQFRLWDALEQANSDCGDKTPIVCHRKNNKPWVVVVELDKHPELIKRMKKYAKN